LVNSNFWEILGFWDFFLFCGDFLVREIKRDDDNFSRVLKFEEG